MYCTKCAASIGPTHLFCRKCGTQVKSPDQSDGIEIVGANCLPASPSSSQKSTLPSIRVSSSREQSSASSLTNEVRAQKMETTRKDRLSNKDILPTSSYGLDPRGKAIQQRTAELFTVERGMAPVRVPGALKRMKLLPSYVVEDWSTWVREQAHGFKSQDTREDPDNFVEDEGIPAFVGVVYSAGQGPAELEYSSSTPLASLLADVPEDGKTKIALIIPVRNISKEEAENLVLPRPNKRAKSPTGAVIPKRTLKQEKKKGRPRKGVVKKGEIKDNEEEEKEEEECKVKIEEDVEEESDFLDVDEIVSNRRKNVPNSKYPKDKYEI